MTKEISKDVKRQRHQPKNNFSTLVIFLSTFFWQHYRSVGTDSQQGT
jgi:hypothetical protein